ncbi:MAG: hypothetical protein IT338_07435 [Thermomicrobiales bacterium]|nr:hypothetical protein [Thermomicrobiales bacterium]
MWTVIAALASVITAVQLIPQAWSAIRASDLKSVSLLTFATISFTTFLWVMYGTHIGDTAVVFANGITCLCAVTISLMKIRKG